MRKEKTTKEKIKWNELNWKTQNFLRKLNNLLFPTTYSQTFGNEELTLQNCKNCCATESDLHVAVCICLSRVNVIWYLNSHKQKSRFSCTKNSLMWQCSTTFNCSLRTKKVTWVNLSQRPFQWTQFVRSNQTWLGLNWREKKNST